MIPDKKIDITEADVIYIGEENIKYIRKDALMEWLEEARAIPHENAITRDLAFQEVVNKLISL